MAVLMGVRARRFTLGGAGVVGLLAASHAAADIPFSAVSALLPTIQARFGLSESALALLVAALAFAASVTQPLFGVLADRVGGRPVGAIGVVASSALLAFVGVAPSLWLVFGLVLAGGLASAAMHPAFTSLSRRNAGTHPSLAVSLYSAGGTLGVAIGPIAVLTLMSAAGVDGTPWLLLPGVLLGLATYFFIPADRQADVGRTPIVGRALLLGPVGLLTVAVTLAGVPFIAFGAAIPLWLVTEQGLAPDDTFIGWTLSAFALAAAVGGVAGGTLGPRVAPRLAVPGTMLLAIVPLAATMIVAPGTPAFFITVILAGGLLNASLPIAIVTAQDLAPRSIAAASGMLMGLAHGVAGLLYIGVGALQEAIGVGAAFVATAALLPPAAAIAYVVLRRVPRGTGGPLHGPATNCPCPV